ncbi:tetratricopeptide repeat protein, partial [Microvirga aerilata]
LGRLDEAEAVLHEILRQAPQHLGAHLGLGWAARKRGDHARALACFQAAAAIDPNHLGVQQEIAYELPHLGRLDEAEAVLHEILRQAPQHLGAHLGLGWAARKRGDHARALACFQAAAAIDPNHLGVQQEIASEFRDRGLYDDARGIIDAVLQREPDNIPAQMQLAYIQRHAGNREAARAEFHRISQANPRFFQAFVELAIEERTLGRPESAAQILEQVLAQQPDHLAALTQLAESARLAGDLESCLSIYHRAIELHPGIIWLYVQASQTLNERGDHVAALALLDTATSTFGEQWEIACKRVELLKWAGHLDEARRLAEDVRRNNPHSFWAWSHCVQLDLLVGSLDAAAEKLERFSSEATTERARIQIFRGHLAEAQYRFEEAREHYQAALLLNPLDGWAHAEMFRICMLLLRVDEAGKHLEAWTKLDVPARIARGQSTNMSQSHMGQVHNEFVLNKDLIDQLATIRRLPPEDRIAQLRNLLRSNADHSAPAIQLIIALCQARLENPTDGKNNQDGFAPIPKVIVQYWDDPEPPEDVTGLMATWRSTNQDYRHHVFDDAAARAFLAEHYAPHVLRAYRRADNPAEKADLFRLAYLFAKGGVYVDADDRCLAPIGTVLPSHVALAVYQEDYALGGLAVGTLGNNFLAAAPNNAVIGRAFDLATEALNRGDTDVVWLKTGPALITRAFAEVAAKTPLTMAAWLKNIAVLRSSQLFGFAALHCFTAYKKTTRHWSNTINPTRITPTRK